MNQLDNQHKTNIPTNKAKILPPEPTMLILENDDVIQNFLFLRKQSTLESSLTLVGFKETIVIERRHELLRKLLEIEWDQRFCSKSDDNSQRDIKELVKAYLSSTSFNDEGFSMIYNYFQEKISDPGEILYYLNPLKFDKHTTLAMSILKIGPNLDYSGFISACKLAKIEINVLHEFIERMGDSKYAAKCLQIVNRNY
ncbi:Hypothetical protein HVR_LOCUS1090 [uncultured virus]|nr:Hypothetical protein HVR_LOCUS1090 [uncultured virus]